MKVNLKKFSLESWGWLLSIIIATGLMVPIFGPYLTHPNDYMYAFGGDALVIYYDMVYHICHGGGTTFEGLNYPYGEYVFMTDMQGMLSILLAWWQQHFGSVCEHVGGIIHILNLLGLLLGVVLVWFTLMRLEIHVFMSTIFSPAIVLLSPQMLRFGGHFGLAYPFLIPLTILWFLRKERVKRAEIRDLFFVLTMTFFTFNNPYSGMTAIAPLLLALLWRSMVSKQSWQWTAYGVLLAVIPVIIPMITFAIQDKVTDRLELQWGFFFYNSSLSGLVSPPGSPMNIWLNGLGVDLGATQDEGVQYLGAATIIGIVVGFPLYVWRKSKGKIGVNREWLLLILVALSLFLATSDLIWSRVNASWIEDHLGFVLMFKAMARFNWATYFILAYLVIGILQHLITDVRMRWLLSSLLLYLWISDIDRFVKARLEGARHANFLSGHHHKDMKDIVEAYDIDSTHYQAILALPKMVAWHDNIISDIHFNTQFYSMRLGLASGVPLISPMLSRMSGSEIASAAELTSHPWTKKGRWSDMPSDKPIVLLLGKDHPPLDAGTLHLIQKADTIVDQPAYTLFSLPFDADGHRSKPDLATLILGPALLYNGGNQRTDHTMWGELCIRLNKGENVLIDTIIESSDEVMLSYWTWIDTKRYGMGESSLQIFDANNKLISTETIDNRKSPNIQVGWIESSYQWKVNGKHRIKLVINTQKQLYIDEILVRLKSVHHLEEGSESNLLDGYIIAK